MVSVGTAAGQRDVAGFAAIGTIVETVGAKAHVLLPLADGAVLFTGAALFRQVALRAIGRSLHKGLSAKLYLSMGGCGKPKVRTVRESLTSFGGRTTLSGTSYVSLGKKSCGGKGLFPSAP